MDTSDRGGREGVLDDNVVRLPRDWLGPREDLIPFGTTSERGPSGGSVPTADDFWGESSAAVQDAVQRPPIQGHSRAPRRARRGGGSGGTRGPARRCWRPARASAIVVVKRIASVPVGVRRRSDASRGRLQRPSAAPGQGAPPQAKDRETQNHLPEPCSRHGGRHPAGHDPGLAGLVVCVDNQPGHHLVARSLIIFIERRRIDRRQQPDVELRH
jgi:hypothetical protein